MNYFREALEVLAANRLRTILALLGLVVGVSAVIAIQVLGAATSGATAGIFQGFSDHTFIVYPNVHGTFSPEAGLLVSDVDALNSLSNVKLAIPYETLTRTAQIGHNNAQLTIAPAGSDPQFLSQALDEGRGLGDDDVAGSSHVCLLSNNAFTKLSPNGADILGSQVRVGSFHCSVIGVLKKPPTGAANFNFSPDIIVPYTAFEREYLRGQKIYEVQVLIADTTELASTEDAVKASLSAAKHGKYTYQTFDSKFFANQLNKFFGILTFVIGAVGAISLVVAGIGIMNILLVSIVERTREIGVRKAIGAQRRQIMLQFFLEASLLAFGGSFVGTLLGLLAGWFVNTRYIVKLSGVIVPLPWTQSVLIAVIFAVVITLAFGTYPAYRAASLNPIEALRYE